MSDRLATIRNAAGRWSGMSQLILPDTPIQESASLATLSSVAQGKFVMLAYTWSYQGTAQDGMLLIGSDRDSGAVYGTFIDSWHMDDQAMQLHGSVDTHGAFTLDGSYAVEGSPDWGWRIVVTPAPDVLSLQMYNLAPTGEIYPGVEAHYGRA